MNVVRKFLLKCINWKYWWIVGGIGFWGIIISLYIFSFTTSQSKSNNVTSQNSNALPGSYISKRDGFSIYFPNMMKPSIFSGKDSDGYTYNEYSVFLAGHIDAVIVDYNNSTPCTYNSLTSLTNYYLSDMKLTPFDSPLTGPAQIEESYNFTTPALVENFQISSGYIYSMALCSNNLNYLIYYDYTNEPESALGFVNSFTLLNN